MIRCGLQIPNFTYPGVGPEDLFEQVSTIAVTAEQSGFDTLHVMDNFYQLPMLGAPDEYMLEGYVLLSALAARTESVMLGTLVTGNTYRNPAHLAKIVTDLDVVSKGRAILGIGAGWFEEEHIGYGFHFGTFGERFDRLEEALRIIRPMFRDERPTFEGEHYTTKGAINQPPPVREGGPPVLIGGAGEKRTLRIAAEHADLSNLNCAPDEVPRKLEVLAEHCADVGRERSKISVTCLNTLFLGESQEEAERLRDTTVRERAGVDWSDLDEGARAMLGARFVVGGPDEVVEQCRERFLDAGLDGLTFNMPANGHDPEAVALAGQTLRRAVEG